MTTAAATVLPHPKAVRDMLEELLGRDVEVAPCDPLVPGEKELVSVAVYVDDSLRTCALVACDLPLSAFAGAAIGLIPRGGAEACVEDRELSPMVRDNLYEVLNIVSALFNLPGHVHTRLYDLHAPGELPPADVSAALRAIGRRLDLTVEIGGYGSGRIAVVLV